MTDVHATHNTLWIFLSLAVLCVSCYNIMNDVHSDDHFQLLHEGACTDLHYISNLYNPRPKQSFLHSLLLDGVKG